jgi:hypothetical protein
MAGPGPTLSRRKEMGSTELRWAEVDPQETFRFPESGRSTIKIEAYFIKIRWGEMTNLVFARRGGKRDAQSHAESCAVC